MPAALLWDFSLTRQYRKGLGLVFSLFLLMACSGSHQSSPVHPQNVRANESCSTLGTLACATLARLSGKATPTCSVSISGHGKRTELCGAIPEGLAAGAHQASRTSAGAPDGAFYPVQISWADNSDNEEHFVIERCDAARAAPLEKRGHCVGTWEQISVVSANATSYTDGTARVNRTYIYRIKAVNRAGSSKYTEEALISTPAVKQD
jgi:hypothetical protein